MLDSENIKHLLSEVSENLWKLGTKETTSTLIWPQYRNGGRRVSEQELRILCTQYFEKERWPYSIETPTTETYIQSGTTAMSGRVDLTVYDSNNPNVRSLNIELKAHNPGFVSFRKDFEKLVREGQEPRADCLWFHLLEYENPSRIRVILREKLKVALEGQEKIHLDGRTLWVALTVLDRRRCYLATLTLSNGWKKEWDSITSSGDQWQCFESGQWTDTAPVQGELEASQKWQGTGKKLLIYCPQIERCTFILLTIRGEGYSLRTYPDGIMKDIPKPAGALNASSFINLYPFLHVLDARGIRLNAKKAGREWSIMINKLNAEHGIT